MVSQNQFSGRSDLNVSWVYKYEHRKLLLESIWIKSMDELDIVVVSVITGYSQNFRLCVSRKN